MFGDLGVGLDRKTVEVSLGGGDFTAEHGGKPFCGSDALGFVGVIDVLVVLGRDGEFDTFAGETDQALNE